MARITDPEFRLRDHHAAPSLPASPKLGLNLDKPHRPTLRLADYIHRELAEPPAAISRPHPEFEWGILANDRIRDCVCFPPGTRVRMADGTTRPIESLQVLDRVVTAEGRESLVTSVMARWHAQPLIRVVAWGHQHLRLTAEHPILTRRGYVPAAALTAEDWIALPHWQPERIAAIEPARYFEASELRRIRRNGTFGAGRTLTQQRIYDFPEQIALDSAFGELIGLFLAEGSTNQNLVRLTFGEHELETLVARAVELIEVVLHADVGVRVRRSSAAITLCGRHWRMLFETLCAKGAAGKEMHPDLWGGGEEFLRGVLIGWLAGDGWRQRATTTGTTVSRGLAQDMFNVAQLLGLAPTIRVSDNAVHKPRWDVAIAATIQRRGKTSAFPGVTRSSNGGWLAWGYDARDRRTVNLGTFDDERRASDVAADWRREHGPLGNGRKLTEVGVTWRRVRRIEEEGYAGPVFNVSVQGDQSYIAEGIGVHNCAMMLHSIEDFHLDAGTPVPAFSDQDAISIYSAITGYNPKHPNSDQGTDEGAAMRHWESPGLKTSDGETHMIVATVAVDPTNLNECRIAIDEFVDLQIGIALPMTAQGQTEWTVVGDGKTGNSAPGSWGGHGIPYREYDAETFKCVTWGAELLLTVPFHQGYAQEAHVVVTQEMLSKQGIGPSGVNWDELLADIKALPRQRHGGNRTGAPLRLVV